MDMPAEVVTAKSGLPSPLKSAVVAQLEPSVTVV
jgi:hypothetical protein